MVSVTQLLDEFANGLSTGYHQLASSLTFEYSSLLNVFIFSLLISAYAIFTWKFYRFLSKRDLIELNLQQYNIASHPFLAKFFGVILYFVEFVVILPFIIFFWFAVLGILILILSEELTADKVIVLSAAMIASIRILSYYQDDLSKDLAKIFPFTILTIILLTPSFFSLPRILDNLGQIPAFLGNIVLYLVFIMAVELILRVIGLIFGLFDEEVE